MKYEGGETMDVIEVKTLLDMDFEEFEREIRKELFCVPEAARVLINLSVSYPGEHEICEQKCEEKSSTRPEGFKQSYDGNVAFSTFFAALAGDIQAYEAIKSGRLLGILDLQSMHFFELTSDFQLVPSDLKDFLHRLFLLTRSVLNFEKAAPFVVLNFEFISKVENKIL